MLFIKHVNYLKNIEDLKIEKKIIAQNPLIKLIN